MQAVQMTSNNFNRITTCRTKVHKARHVRSSSIK